MINIVSNDCFSGFFYRENNLSNCSIFPWVNIPYPVYLNMLKEYESLDFENTKILYYWELAWKQILEQLIPYQYGSGTDIRHKMIFGLINDKYLVQFTHYYLDETFFDTIYKSGLEVRSAKIRNYVEEHTKNRYERMKLCDKTVFVLSEKNADESQYQQHFDEFVSIKTNNTKVFAIRTDDKQTCQYWEKLCKDNNIIFYNKDIYDSNGLKLLYKMLNNTLPFGS